MNADVKAKLMDGRTLARQMQETVADKVDRIKSATGVTPCLATVLVGTDPASVTYTKMKRKRCVEVGIEPRRVELPASTDTVTLLAALADLANDDSVHGMLLQHPVPSPIDRRAAFEAIPLVKDVDAVSSVALGRVMLGMETTPCCTPAGIMHLLNHYNVQFKGAKAVVIGRSPILGRPMASMLINAHATVTLCHSHTRNLSDLVFGADLVIAAVGKARFVKGDWIKPGAVVVDAGYNEGNIGDVDFEAALERASLITPVPGGVGPLTIATLLDNTVETASRQLGLETVRSASRAR